MIIWHNIALLPNDSHHTKWVKQTGRLDHDQRLLQMVKPYLTGTVIDVGAHIGTHAVFYVNYAPRVICFEANPQVFKCLEHNVPSAELHNVAIGDHPHKIDINVPPYVPPEESEYDGINYGAAWTIPGNKIPVQTLDYFMVNLDISNCSFIKIDVEGDELAVLSGAKLLLKRQRPTLLIEINDSTLIRKDLTRSDIFTWLSENDYSWDLPDDDIACDILCHPGD